MNNFKLIVLLLHIFLMGACSRMTDQHEAVGHDDVQQTRAKEPSVHEAISDILDRFPFAENGPFDIPSADKVCLARKTLANIVSGSPPPRQMAGEILIEGILLEARSIKGEKQILTVKVTGVPFGVLEDHSKELSIISPLERVGGVPVSIGEEYRMLLLPLDGKYYSWAAAGSAPKKPSFGGYYKCFEKD